MKKLIILTTIAITSVLGACQTVPPENADLTAARVYVARASDDPYVARTGGVELHRAQEAMQNADIAWADRRDTEETRHLAYIAAQRAQIALAVGERARADERVQTASVDRERLRLEARTHEADVATDQARAAQAQAEQSAQSEQMSREQAMLATSEADSARALAAQEAEHAAGLQRDLQDLQAKNTDRGTLITLGDVLFESGRATLLSGAHRTVDKLSKVLQEHPERRVLIEGFTDNTGSEEFNRELSRRRAETVQQALVDSGIPKERIEVRGSGDSSPVADNSTPSGRQQNRRVEVLFSDTEGHFAGG